MCILGQINFLTIWLERSAIGLMLLALGSCATTRVEQSRQPTSVLGDGEAMVILGRVTPRAKLRRILPNVWRRY